MIADRSSFRRVVKRLVTPPLVVLATALMLVEEYLWHGLVRFGIWFGRLPPIAELETRLAALTPTACLVALLVPVGLAVPIELFALWQMAAGHFLAGVALVARIYTLCEPKLATIAWFVGVRDIILGAKNWAHQKLEAQPAWRVARKYLRIARQWAARALSQSERRA